MLWPGVPCMIIVWRIFRPWYYWINVRDPLYLLGYGLPYMYVKRISCLPRVIWAKIRPSVLGGCCAQP